MSEPRVTREDLEAKVREIQESLGAAAETAKRSTVPLLVAVILVVLGFTYFLGRRSAKRKPVVVEVLRG
ncbi:MAG: hypothetical protein C4318_02025 [Acidimicrobiia bacterium]